MAEGPRRLVLALAVLALGVAGLIVVAWHAVDPVGESIGLDCGSVAFPSELARDNNEPPWRACQQEWEGQRDSMRLWGAPAVVACGAGVVLLRKAAPRRSSVHQLT